MQCQIHNSKIVKVQLNCKRLLCEKCLEQTQVQKRRRIQQLRSKLQASYQQEIKIIQSQKFKIDKFIQNFTQKNMTQAKKIINKASNETQKYIENIIEQQIIGANKLLNLYCDQLLKKYKILDQKNLSELHLEFDKQKNKIQKLLENRKMNLKKEIGLKVKQAIRKFYQNLFQF